MASTSPSVLVLATLATKEDETGFFVDCLQAHGVKVDVLDTSLASDNVLLDGPGKVAAMQTAVTRAVNEISDRIDKGVNAVAGIGGGTGGEIILRAMRALPITFPKLLVSTMAFDPRAAVADNSIVLVPTLADLCGLNATLREVLENAAAMTAGLCSTRRQAGSCVDAPSVGVTSLGVTEAGILPIVEQLRSRGREATVFHSNGYGGAAFARFAARGAFTSIVDATPHELTRILVAGAHVDMPDRFTAAPYLPRIVLPGGLNFVGLGEAHLLPQRFLDRPHYAHSGLFTHAKLTHDEMEGVATRLCRDLNDLTGPRHLIVPMGGFSNQDRPGGAIEDAPMRGVFLETARATLSSEITLAVLDAHLFDDTVSNAVVSALDHMQTSTKDLSHA